MSGVANTIDFLLACSLGTSFDSFLVRPYVQFLQEIRAQPDSGEGEQKRKEERELSDGGGGAGSRSISFPIFNLLISSPLFFLLLIPILAPIQRV